MVDFETFAAEFKALCDRNGIALKGEHLQKFFVYLNELLRWNRVHNLTAVRNWREVLKRHFCDSLTLVKFFEAVGYPVEGKKLADVGSGAGFPGVPLQIYYGDALKVHLIESVSKKCSFLTYLKGRLGVDYEVHCRKAEELELKVEVAVARALEVKGKKTDPVRYADGLLTKLATELAVIMKGRELDAAAVRELGYEVFELDLPDFKGMKILYKFLR
ncbi:MAG: 16S rRNA (guanine(527)-N(7))-methyltransferase RsmG [Aquificae bacterium]|nr:16S rRNA (guanine(527)-N(7))-methyltransferase RsmG [Aquificota bacterium]